MAYDSSLLSPNDPTLLAWGLAWVRFMLRDTTTPEQYADAELTAMLISSAFTTTVEGVEVTYYRPHLAAESLIASDPDRAISESLLGASITNRDPASIARSVRKAGAWIDKLIASLAGVKPPTGRTLEAVF